MNNLEDIHAVITTIHRSVLIFSLIANHFRSTISWVTGTCQSGDGRLARIREQDKAHTIN